MQYDLNSLTIVFDEWVKRYSENSEDHIDLLNKNGKPADSIGKTCAEYFQELSNELLTGGE